MGDSGDQQLAAYANNSGTGGVPPPQIMHMGFNWGAFFLNWIWGIAHGVWNSLLVFLLGLIWMVVLGIKGNEWAWRNRRFASIEQFRQTQAVWSRWGWAFFLVIVALMGALLALVVGGALVARGFGSGGP